MSARLARTAFAAAARRAQPAARLAPRRAMSSTSHGAQVKSNDTPWIIGSALVFLPAFLYLVSPSARKTEHMVHDDKHDFPALKHEKTPTSSPQEEDTPIEPSSTPAAPSPAEQKEKNQEKAQTETATEDKAESEPASTLMTMTDDEGTVADVGSSIAVAEGANSPKSSQTPEAQSEHLEAAKSAPVEVDGAAVETSSKA